MYNLREKINRIGGDIIAPGPAETSGHDATKNRLKGSKAKTTYFRHPDTPMKAALLLTISLLFCGAAMAQTATPTPSPTTGIEEVYLAKDDGEGKAGEQVTEFGTTDIPIYCVVLLESNRVAVVKMNFVAVSVAGVKPETKVVTASYTTKNGQNRVNFTGRPEGKWTPGKYRVDLFLDGKITKTVEFQIKSTSVGPPGASSFQSAKPKPVRRPAKP
jgi:hypothetical protein